MRKLNKLFIAPLFAVALFSTNSLTAQNTDVREELKIGIKAGANYSNVYSESGEGFVADGKVGFAGGVFVSIPLSQLVGIQPELLYSQKGFKGEVLGTEYEATFNYLDLPIHLQIKPTSNISILAGPQLSYLLSSDYELGNLQNTVNEDDERRAVLGLSAGVDFTIENLLISARGSWDLSKFNEDNSTSDVNYKNQLFQLTLGYRF